MKLNRDNSNRTRKDHTISVNNVISNLSHISPSQVLFQKISPSKTNQQKFDTISYSSGNYQRGRSGYAPSKALVENNRYIQTESIKENPEILSNIIKTDITNEETTTQASYKNRFVKIINTSNNNKTIYKYNYSNRDSNSNMRNSVSYVPARSSSLSNINQMQTPSDHKMNNLNSIRKHSQYKYSNINYYTDNKSQTISCNTNNDNIQIQYQTIDNNNIKTRYSQKIPMLPKKIIFSNYCTRINPNSIITKRVSNSCKFERKSISPRDYDLNRKTINRGDPVKNVQITHVICSNQPNKFNIKEKLSTESIDMEPIRLTTQTERYNIQRRGKNYWTNSNQDKTKPVNANLKGVTTIYQHARGIGMTNDTKGKLNPQFYTSTIRKLYPIRKIKQKEKVEYMSFRNEHRRNIIFDHNAKNNTNQISINNSINEKNNIRFSVNLVRNLDNCSSIDIDNQIEIINPTTDNINNENRSQYKPQRNPIIYNKNERMIYHSNNFFKK